MKNINSYVDIDDGIAEDMVNMLIKYYKSCNRQHQENIDNEIDDDPDYTTTSIRLNNIAIKRLERLDIAVGAIYHHHYS